MSSSDKRVRILLLDGGIGQELVKRHAKPPTKYWASTVLIEKPELLTDVHKEYFEVGATYVDLFFFLICFRSRYHHTFNNDFRSKYHHTFNNDYMNKSKQIISIQGGNDQHVRDPSRSIRRRFSGGDREVVEFCV